jgi:hypothetical protein
MSIIGSGSEIDFERFGVVECKAISWWPAIHAQKKLKYRRQQSTERHYPTKFLTAPRTLSSSGLFSSNGDASLSFSCTVVLPS